MTTYPDRRHAGRLLAGELARYEDRDDVVVLALPRGGVPVAFEVASALRAPLDVFIVRKLGVPGHEELAMGALATGGVEVLNEDVIDSYGIRRHAIDEVVEHEHEELERRELLYRQGRPPADVAGKTVILVDDGIATGASLRAAIQALRRREPARIVVAAPVGAASTCWLLAEQADELTCPHRPEPFHSVGQWYQDFRQTSDADVQELLAAAAARVPQTHGAAW